MTYRFIGKDFIRHDGIAKVTGQLEFPNDIYLPGMLYGRILKSPYPHAIVKKIKVEKAERLGAVVITPWDVPRVKFNPRLVSVEEATYKDWEILTDHPRFVGEYVAAVAAESEYLAQKALESLEVEWEKLPFSLNPFKSMSDPSIRIHDKILLADKWVNVENNIACKLDYVEGDPDEAFNKADVVIERSFHTNRRYHLQLEPKAVVVKPEINGGVTIWTTTQSIHNTRILVSQVFNIPLNKVNVVKVPVGGSFGSSIQTNPVVLVATALALKARRPVKISLTREEDMYEHCSYEMYLKIKAGALGNGTLIAGELENIMDIGAHQIQPYPLLGVALGWFVSLYKWKNIRYRGLAVYTNKVPSGAMRGFGNPQVTWAVETIIDELAEKLGVDPIDFRLKNYVGRGDVFWGQGPTVKSVIKSDGVPYLLTKGAELIGWSKRGDPRAKKGRYRIGIGVARGFHTSGAGGPLSGSVIDYTGAILKLNEDGTIDYITALQDCGGGTLDAHVKIIAEELQVHPEKIRVVYSDTSTTIYDVCTHASRGVFVGGEAARRAAHILKEKIKQYAWYLLGEIATPDAIKIKYDEETRETVLYVEGVAEKQITLRELAKMLWQKNIGSLSATVSYRAPSAPPAYTVCFVKLLVDTWTGIVKPLEVVFGVDCGTVINPGLAEGQVHGGFMMGWSMALLENTVYDEETGELLNRGYLIDYKIPSAQDTINPDKFTVFFAETYEPDGPYGAKGLGEAAKNPVAAAVANAIYNAIGVRFYELPITPEKIVEALHKKLGGENELGS
ncbi:MAG: carbon monoxide dehydrogenase [Desulfurococcales archaeon ex4484_58]|nr:MAG: carbon monoxide dehydrogenase [Desulfurococcales archaeon ex4484_58]